MLVIYIMIKPMEMLKPINAFITKLTSQKSLYKEVSVHWYTIKFTFLFSTGLRIGKHGD